MDTSDGHEELDLITILREIVDSEIRSDHAGIYNQYVFYFASLTEEDVLFLSLRFGTKLKILESKNQTNDDLVIRIFTAGYKPRLSR